MHFLFLCTHGRPLRCIVCRFGVSGVQLRFVSTRFCAYGAAPSIHFLRAWSIRGNSSSVFFAGVEDLGNSFDTVFAVAEHPGSSFDSFYAFTYFCKRRAASLMH